MRDCACDKDLRKKVSPSQAAGRGLKQCFRAVSYTHLGLPYIGLQANWQQIITGLILILAVFIDVIKNRKLA